MSLLHQIANFRNKRFAAKCNKLVALYKESPEEKKPEIERKVRKVARSWGKFLTTYRRYFPDLEKCPKGEIRKVTESILRSSLHSDKSQIRNLVDDLTETRENDCGTVICHDI